MSKDIISVITRAMNFNEDTMGAHTAQDILDSLTAAGYAVVPQYRTEMGAAAERYLYKVCRHAHPLPQQFKWEDCFNEMLAAALAERP